MKIFLTLFFLALTSSLFSQTKLNPIITNYGGIFDIPDAVMKPDPTLKYNIVIDVASGSENPKQINDALNNVARMINLHAVGGVSKENLHVVLAIHGGATYAILNDEAYKSKYGSENPNTKLIQALSESGIVSLYVCGQSLIGRGVAHDQVSSHVKVATSMLTTVTTFQLKGYAALKF